MSISLPTEAALFVVKRRPGQFRVTREVIDQVLDGKPDAVAAWNALMSDVVIIKAQSCFHSRTVEYFGYHPHFDVCEMGVMPPEYDAVLTRDVGDHGMITFSRTFRKNP